MTQRWNRFAIVLVAAAASTGVPLAGDAPAAPAFPGANGKIAFYASDGSDTEIFVMEPDGTDVTPLTANGVPDGHPVWSADGTQIVFTSLPDGDDGEIFVMDADGSGRTPLTANGLADAYPTWSPDGSRIAFMRDVAGDIFNPNFQIFVMNADGSGQTQLTFGFGAGAPDWAPDGSKIAFHETVDFGVPAIVVMNADGSGRTVLSPSGVSDLSPSWSPDGAEIAFQASAGITVMNADGTGRTLVAAGGWEPAWSPDGTKIVYVLPDSAGTQINVVNADGSGLSTVHTLAGFVVPRPDWQPLVTQSAFADLALTLEGSGQTANTNKTFRYTITIENRGPAPAAGVVVSDVLDANEQFQSVTTTHGTCDVTPAIGSTGAVECELGQLAVSEVVTIEVVVALPARQSFGAKRPEVSHAASVGGTTADAVAGNNTAILVTKVVGP